jgi:hypothetical protein
MGRFMSPTRMSPLGEASDILTPQPDETIARLGEIAALRAITDQLNRMGTFMQTMNDTVGEMRTDIAVMKLQDERIRKVEHEQGEQGKRLTSLEMVNASDEGARNGFKTVREWAPFLLTLLVAVVTLLKTGAIHL